MVMAVVMGGAITAGAAITTAGRAVVIAAGIKTQTKHKVAIGHRWLEKQGLSATARDHATDLKPMNEFH